MLRLSVDFFQTLGVLKTKLMYSFTFSITSIVPKRVKIDLESFCFELKQPLN